eukprot:8530940-Pyramimonas_sp.AAC.1
MPFSFSNSSWTECTRERSLVQSSDAASQRPSASPTPVMSCEWVHIGTFPGIFPDLSCAWFILVYSPVYSLVYSRDWARIGPYREFVDLVHDAAGSDGGVGHVHPPPPVC